VFTFVELTVVVDTVGGGGRDQAAATHAQCQTRKKRRRLRLHARIPSLAWCSHTRTLISAIPLDGLELSWIIARAGRFVVRQKTVNTFGIAATVSWALQALCSGVLDWNGGDVCLRVVSVSLSAGCESLSVAAWRDHPARASLPSISEIFVTRRPGQGGDSRCAG